jgi:hypothetical protein
MPTVSLTDWDDVVDDAAAIEEPKRKKAYEGRYVPDFAEQARVLCETGATDYELSLFFDVTPKTIAFWQVVHPEFRAALKIGKGIPDDRVERSFFNRAVGYTFDTEEVHVVKVRDGEYSEHVEIVRVPVTKHVPPDTRAAAIWLSTRRRDVWGNRDKNEQGTYDQRAVNAGRSDVSGLSDDELARVYREAAAAAGALREEPPVSDAGAGDVPPRREALVR